jgi:hypothetical protein
MNKFISKTLIIIVAIIAFQIINSGFLSSAFAYQPPPCLKLVDSSFRDHPIPWGEDNILVNFDSIKIDTCTFKYGHDNLNDTKLWYCKKGFEVTFKHLPFDTVNNKSGIFQVIDILDTLQQCKSVFQSIITNFSNLNFSVKDSKNSEYYVWFDIDIPVDSITTIINSIGMISKIQKPYYIVLVDINENILSLKNDVKVIPNPSYSKIRIENPYRDFCNTIDIFNIQGYMVLSERIDPADEFFEIDVSALSEGTYFILMNEKKAKFNIVR